MKAGEPKLMTVMEKISSCGIVPVVVLEDAARALPLARAFIAGGVDVMEITLRTPAGLESIRRVAESCPEMCVGAGTVVTPAQAEAALEAGARFIVSPGLDGEIVGRCLEKGVAVIPGCVTPTEIMRAMSLGLNTLKFFPANVYGGLAAMKALAAPFGGVKFIPTGGVSDKNLAEYLSESFVYAVGGSWLCAASDVAEGNLDRITRLCMEARAVAETEKNRRLS